MVPDCNTEILNTSNLQERKIIFFKPYINEKNPNDPVLYMAKKAKNLGNHVEILTSVCKKDKTDEEFKNITVHQIGALIPEQVYGWGRKMFYLIRILFMLLWLIKMKTCLKPNIIVIQNAIALLPIIKLIGEIDTVQMYTFEDQELLSAASGGFIKKRDLFSHICMSFADKIIVSNKLSRKVFMKAFCVNKNPIIFYPCTAGTEFERSPLTSIHNIMNMHKDSILLVCFGRMCIRSNFELCVEAFSMLMEITKSIERYLYFNTYLVIASQYEFTKEHVTYYKKLKRFTQNHSCNKDSVIFVNEVPFSYKKTLMFNCDAVLFPMVSFKGRTILEAGVMKKPVIATNAGIARELIIDGLNGFLVPPNPLDFAKSMATVLYNRDIIATWSHDIFKHVQKNFGLNQYYRKFRYVVARNSQYAL